MMRRARSMGPTPRSRIPLFGDHHAGSMLTMVDVRAEWHDRRDLSPFGHRWADKDGIKALR